MTPPSPVALPPKTGLGTGAKIGIGCGIIVLLAIIGIVIGSVMLAGKAKKFAEDAQKNPTRTTADMMVSASFGAFEMVAQDDVNKRYTVKEKKSGSLTTIYWDEKTKTAKTISGDFTAIPADAASPP